jgi:inner membrane protein YhjD
MKNPIRSLDEFQQRHRFTAFVFGVIKKFGDDAGTSLAALVTYYGFLAIFPLLMVMVTVLGLFARNSSISHSLESSAVAQFPLVGNELKANVHGLQAGGGLEVAFGVLVAIYGSLGVSQAAQRAMAEVWNIPGVKRPGYFPRMVRSLAFLLVLALSVFATTAISGLATFGANVGLFRESGFKVGIEIIVLFVNVALYWLAFRILTPSVVASRDLVPGALLGGAGWTVLQGIGVFLVGHTLRRSTEVYGTFATVLGLIAWLFLASQLSIYAAELNVVRRYRLWPRSIIQPPLTDADKRVLDRIALVGERRPEQTVESSFDPAGEAQ